GNEDDLVLLQERWVPFQREVEAAERRAAIAGDEGGRVETAAAVGAVLVEGQPHEGLDPGEKDQPLFLTVLGVQREVTLDRHWSPSAWSYALVVLDGSAHAIVVKNLHTEGSTPGGGHCVAASVLLQLDLDEGELEGIGVDHVVLDAGGSEV